MSFNRAIEHGDWAAAWAAHHSLVELNDDPAAAAARRSGLLKDTEKAVREAANERSPETAELCRLFLDAEPGDPRMTLILGRALLRERRYEEALPIWRYLRDASPNDVEPALQLARLAKRLDDWTLGAQESARLLAMAPDHEEGAALKRHFDENTAAG
jgi:tetratricopeptide (TPR) repeat protein